MDASDPVESIFLKRRTCYDVLDQIAFGAVRPPVVEVLNKVDLLSDEAMAGLRQLFPGANFTSALTGQNLEAFQSRVARMLGKIHI
ncbi:MAG: hypothetical protein Kow0069_32210 [Promethearchaeota archaeon]